MTHVLQEEFAQLRRWARLVSRRRWLVLGVAAVTAVACAAGLATLPDRYQAGARIYVDTQTVLKPLMANLAYQPDIDQQVVMLARTLVSRPNIERLVHRPELDFDVSDPRETERLVSALMSQIRITPTPSGNLYDITYRGSSPESAQRLVEATLDLFVHAGAHAKKIDSQEAGRFIEAQIHTYADKLAEVEGRLKDFRIRNFGLAGVSNQDYFGRISSLTEQVSRLNAELFAAQHTRDAYRRELGLASEGSAPPADTTADSLTAPSESELRAQEQRKRLDELLGRYTEEHPDVIATRHLIEQLEAEARQTPAPQSRPAVRAGSESAWAARQQLRLALAEAESRVASLQVQRATQAAQLDELRARAERLPQVEAEQAQLNRDHDIIRATYDSMVARRESAALGVKLDESSQLAEFRVVEPPRASAVPATPTRLQLALAAVVLSIAMGLGAALLADYMAPTVVEAVALRRLTGRPVLGTVSVFATPDTQLARRQSQRRFAAALASLIALQSLWLAWIAFNPPLN
ncbi:MAG: hypothetical protein B7Y51_00660 [Burkholderiales bacterium 28-67-8]|nr:MAG: hypothetical protein B7Y51_00660 [Burkholderiales bacterium 28-67-8]